LASPIFIVIEKYRAANIAEGKYQKISRSKYQKISRSKYQKT